MDCLFTALHNITFHILSILGRDLYYYYYLLPRDKETGALGAEDTCMISHIYMALSESLLFFKLINLFTS